MEMMPKCKQFQRIVHNDQGLRSVGDIENFLSSGMHPVRKFFKLIAQLGNSKPMRTFGIQVTIARNVLKEIAFPLSDQ